MKFLTYSQHALYQYILLLLFQSLMLQTCKILGLQICLHLSIRRVQNTTCLVLDLLSPCGYPGSVPYWSLLKSVVLKMSDFATLHPPSQRTVDNVWRLLLLSQLAPSRYMPGMLLNILQCAGSNHPRQQPQ